MIRRLVSTVLILVLLMNYGECKQHQKVKCIIQQGYQGTFTIRQPITGKTLGNMTVGSSKLTVNYKSQNYIYTCKGFGDRSDVMLFQTKDSNKVLCLQFIHIADHPFAQLVLRRYSNFPSKSNNFFSPLDKTVPGAMVCSLPDPDKPVEVYLQ